ncbi:MAG TPA: hypothetical protein ENI76_06300 [Ignavibacteria bacterium]|nr:hypothetical protein [Ignavibacteria bacterium]
MFTKAEKAEIDSAYTSLTAAINKDGKAIAQKLRTKRANEKEFISNIDKAIEFMSIAMRNLVAIEDISEELGTTGKKETLVENVLCKIGGENSLEMEYKNGTVITFKVINKKEK